MKLYKKRIEDYKNLIQKQYVRDSCIQNVAARCKAAMGERDDIRISYFEFLYEQSKFIKKIWWLLQGCLLFVFWYLLRDSGAAEDMERAMGVMAVLFTILIIPEVWKNRRFSSTEIEGASFYSLRQICAARILLFAVVDVVMVTIFFAVTAHSMQVSSYSMVTDFLLPFNVSGCICFRLLCSRGGETQYLAVLGNMVWLVIWLAVEMYNSLYHIIIGPVWLGLVLLSFGYLIFCIRKSQVKCEIVWEEYANEIGA